MELTEGEEGMVTDLSYMSSGPPQFEYDYDDQGRKMKLGEGTYGVVYSARDLDTQVTNQNTAFYSIVQSEHSIPINWPIRAKHSKF